MPRAVMRAMKLRSATLATVAAYVTCVLIWGTTWLAIKIALTGFPTVFGAGVRFIVAGLALYAIALAARIDLRRAAPPWHLVAVLAVAMFGLNYALTYLAETHLASGLVAVLFGTMPFFMFAFAHRLVGERATRATIAGALAAFAGVALISFTGTVRGDVPYVLATVIAAALSGFANVYLKRHAHGEPLATLPPAMLLSGASMTAWGAIFERVDWSHALAPSSLGAVAYLALCGTALTFYLNHRLLQRVDSWIVGLNALIVPVIAVLVGAAFGHEVLGPRELVGAALVIAGISVSLGGRGSRAPAPRGANATSIA